MTKQDVYDIIDILEPLFKKNDLDVREIMTFRFEDDDYWAAYDDKSLFVEFNDNNQEVLVDHLSGNLVLNYWIPRNRDKQNWQKFCQEVKKEAQFLEEVCQYLTTNFTILQLTTEENEHDQATYITLKDSEVNEGHKLKKYHQF